MRPTRLVLLALAVALLVAAPVAGAATAGPLAPADEPAASDLPVIRGQSNTTNFLDIQGRDVQRGGYGNATLDGSTTVGSAVDRLRGEYATRSFEAAYANTTDRKRRVALVRAEVDRLDARIAELERRQAAALGAYNDGDLSTRGFLADLAAVDDGARSAEAQLDRIVERAGLVIPGDVETRINNLRAELVPLQGPVRERVGRAIAGETASTEVHALTSPTGIVVTTTDGERFYREAYLAADRDPGGEDNFVTDADPTGLNPANDRARELYPWAYGGTSPELSREGTTSVYTVAIDHSQGRLRTHIDGATRNVFREVQILRSNRVPADTVRNRTASVELRVNHTYGTGPMEVVVTDPVSGRPLNGTVFVDDYRVGTTGIDGRLWTTGPHPSGVVTVRTAEGNVSVEVAPR
jgi:hypothetical protein